MSSITAANTGTIADDALSMITAEVIKSHYYLVLTYVKWFIDYELSYLSSKHTNTDSAAVSLGLLIRADRLVDGTVAGQLHGPLSLFLQVFLWSK